MSKTHRITSAAVFVLAFVVNPALFAGCHIAPDFGEKEVVALAQAAGGGQTYRFTNDGADYELTLDLAQVAGSDKLSAADSQPEGVVRVAHACSDRTFLRSAAACLDVTSVPVEGTMTLARKGPAPAILIDHEATKGQLRVIGTRLDSALVELWVGSATANARLRATSAKTYELGDLDVKSSPAAPPSLSYRRN